MSDASPNYAAMSNETLAARMCKKYVDKYGWWKGPAVTEEVYFRLNSFVSMKELVEDLVSLAEDAMHEANRYGGGMYDTEAELREAREYLEKTRKPKREGTGGLHPKPKTEFSRDSTWHIRPHAINYVSFYTVRVEIWDKDYVYFCSVGNSGTYHKMHKETFLNYYEEKEKGA